MLKNNILKENKFITVNLINFYFTRNLNVLKKKKILTETMRLGTYVILLKAKKMEFK